MVHRVYKNQDIRFSEPEVNERLSRSRVLIDGSISDQKVKNT